MKMSVTATSRRCVAASIRPANLLKIYDRTATLASQRGPERRRRSMLLSIMKNLHATAVVMNILSNINWQKGTAPSRRGQEEQQVPARGRLCGLPERGLVGVTGPRRAPAERFESPDARITERLATVPGGLGGIAFLRNNGIVVTRRRECRGTRESKRSHDHFRSLYRAARRTKRALRGGRIPWLLCGDIVGAPMTTRAALVHCLSSPAILRRLRPFRARVRPSWLSASSAILRVGTSVPAGPPSAILWVGTSVPAGPPSAILWVGTSFPAGPPSAVVRVRTTAAARASSLLGPPSASPSGVRSSILGTSGRSLLEGAGGVKLRSGPAAGEKIGGEVAPHVRSPDLRGVA
jgi:hypothetical protein